MAVIVLFRTTSGRLVVYSDYKALVDGFAKGREFTLVNSTMADLWEDLWKALEHRPGGPAQVEVKKIKAHVPEALVRSGMANLCLRHWLGNEKADDLAKKGAADNELDPRIVQRV